MDEQPLRIVVIGAGPIGLEAGLYGRFLGYEVTIVDRGDIAENVRDWGHVEMFSPFGMNSSPLGIAALEGQDPAFQFPASDSYLTGHQWRESYLLPLANSDLLAESIRPRTTVIAVGRACSSKANDVGHPDRCQHEFRLLCRPSHGPATAAQEYYLAADVVIDASGTYGNSNGLGPGGLPARGESAVQATIAYTIPNHRFDFQRYAGQAILVVGGGFSAATTLVELAKIAEQSSDTRVTWLVRQTPGTDGPLPVIPDDSLPRRDALARQVNAWATSPPAWLRYIPGSWVEAMSSYDGREISVTWSGAEEGEANFDRIVANVGYRPNRELYRELQFHECYATEGPMRLAAQLLAESSSDCLKQPEFSADSLCTTEPNFFILGSKSFGRSSRFLIRTGLNQIRHAFAKIGQREGLDLYATIRRQS